MSGSTILFRKLFKHFPCVLFVIMAQFSFTTTNSFAEPNPRPGGEIARAASLESIGANSVSQIPRRTDVQGLLAHLSEPLLLFVCGLTTLVVASQIKIRLAKEMQTAAQDAEPLRAVTKRARERANVTLAGGEEWEASGREPRSNTWGFSGVENGSFY